MWGKVIEPKHCSSLAKHAKNAKTCGDFRRKTGGSGEEVLSRTREGKDRVLPAFATLAISA